MGNRFLRNFLILSTLALLLIPFLHSASALPVSLKLDAASGTPVLFTGSDGKQSLVGTVTNLNFLLLPLNAETVYSIKQTAKGVEISEYAAKDGLSEKDVKALLDSLFAIDRKHNGGSFDLSDGSLKYLIISGKLDSPELKLSLNPDLLASAGGKEFAIVKIGGLAASLYIDRKFIADLTVEKQEFKVLAGVEHTIEARAAGKIATISVPALKKGDLKDYLVVLKTVIVPS